MDQMDIIEDEALNSVSDLEENAPVEDVAIEAKKPVSLADKLLFAMYARAKASGTGAFIDTVSEQIINNMEYDFSEAEANASMREHEVARTIVMDQLAGDFLRRHPGSLVINIGCGLDTRAYRFEGKYDRWYNVDDPKSMVIRKWFFEENGPIHQIEEAPVFNAWAEKVSYAQEEGQQVLVIMENLTMHLTEEDVDTVLDIIDAHFENVTILAEFATPDTVRKSKKTEEPLLWGTKSGARFAEMMPSLIHVTDHSVIDGMAELKPAYKAIRLLEPMVGGWNRIAVLRKKNSAI